MYPRFSGKITIINIFLHVFLTKQQVTTTQVL